MILKNKTTLLKKIKSKIFNLFYSALTKRVVALIVKKYASEDFRNLSYSQEGEDLILNRYFDGKLNGFYCDIGSFHPKQYSNTYLFYLNGWTGINVDPRPGSKELFDSLRPKDINLEFAVSNELETEVSYFLYNNPVYNSLSSLPLEKNRIIGETKVKVISLKVLYGI